MDQQIVEFIANTQILAKLCNNMTTMPRKGQLTHLWGHNSSTIQGSKTQPSWYFNLLGMIM